LGAIAELEWAKLDRLPNVVFIRSRHGHQAIADALMPLLEASPLYVEHVAQIWVHALSSPKTLGEGLSKARDVCLNSDEPWCVALVRGGGAATHMEAFAEVLGDASVRPLLEDLAPRLLFAAGHTRDSERLPWLRASTLIFGGVPLEAGQKFVELLRAKGVLKAAHDAAEVARGDAVGLPTPDDLPATRAARERERFRLHTRKRSLRALENAPILSDTEFIEMLMRGGYLIGFWQHSEVDYRAVAFSQDYILYMSDALYDLDSWRDILELAGLEDWEIKDALQKTRTESHAG